MACKQFIVLAIGFVIGLRIDVQRWMQAHIRQKLSQYVGVISMLVNQSPSNFQCFD